MQQMAERIGRCDKPVLAWVHASNAMTYRRTGGRAPFLRPRSPRGASQTDMLPERGRLGQEETLRPGNHAAGAMAMSISESTNSPNKSDFADWT